MDRDQLRELLEGVKRGDVELDAALKSLSHFPFVDTPSARVDTQRSLRVGIPEVIYGPGKTPAQIVEVVTALRDAGQNVLVTRIEADTVEAVCDRIGTGEYDEVARVLWFGSAEIPVVGKGTIAVRDQHHEPPEIAFTVSEFALDPQFARARARGRQCL